MSPVLCSPKILLAIAALLTVAVATAVLASSVPCPEDPTIVPLALDWKPRDPEQTQFAYVRCLNDSTASVETKVRWASHQPDDSAELRCYVMCLVETLGLFDAKERRFHPERIIQQAEEYGLPASVEEPLRADATAMLSGALDDHSCEEVSRKYLPFFAKHLAVMGKIFHGNPSEVLKTYRVMGDRVKQPGQTFVDFCEKRHEATWKVEDNCLKAALIDCVLRGFRWITDEGEVNVDEISRDYKMAGSPDGFSSECLKFPSGARELFECLRNGDSELLSRVIEERNQRTANYFDVESQEEPWKTSIQEAKRRMNGGGAEEVEKILAEDESSKPQIREKRSRCRPRPESSLDTTTG